MSTIMYYSTNRDDHYVRVCAIKFLCLLDESNALHKTFIEDFVMKLLDNVRIYLWCFMSILGPLWLLGSVANLTDYLSIIP